MDIILNAKIQTRLIAGFATILGLLIATTVIGVVQVTAIDRSLTTINDVNGLKQRYAINFRGSVHDRAIAVRDVIILSEQSVVDEAVAEIRTLEGFYDEAAAGMASVFADPELITDEEKRIFASIQEIETRTLPMIETIIADQAAGNVDAARALLVNEARGAFVTWLARINEFIDLQENNNSVISTKARGLANNFSVLMLSITAACILIGVGFAAWSIKSIRPLNVLTPNMLALAGGDLEVDIPESTTRDEVGEITKAVHVFKKNAIAARENEVEAERLRQESAASEERAKEQQAEAMNSLAAGFEKDVMGIVDSLSQSSQELRRAAEGLSETAVQAGSKTEEVANSTAQASESVETVVESSGRIEQSIGQISSQIDVSSAKTKVAAEQAAETNQIIDGLSSKAESIGEVINLITDIAAQTNLLALNATIEAARAGEAGKGFAVVASEVKSLATQTTRATEEISTRVTEIQSATNSAVDAIKSINTTIEDVNAIATDISGAIGMQRDATTEIVQHVGHATSSVGVVATSVGDLREASGRTQDSSQKLLSSASMLSDQAEGLRAQVGTFLASVKT